MNNSDNFIIHQNTLLLFVFFYCLFPSSQAQVLSGYIYDQNNIPMPYVNVFVKHNNAGTSTDKNGHYSIDMISGDYEIVFSYVGYMPKTIEVVVKDDDINKNVWMALSDVELEQIIVRSKRKDPAYEIIQNVIDNKKKYLSQLSSARAQVYVKATEEVEIKEKSTKEPAYEDVDDLSDKPPFENFESEEKAEDKVPNISFVEMEMTLNFEAPKNYKEERTAYNSYGAVGSLFVPRFGENEFNFYRNSVSMRGVAETSVISPISKTAILSYKYKLRDIITKDGQVIYNIEVIPRKKGNATVQGNIFINDGLWNIHSLDLSFYKSGLRFYDAFSIKQEYEAVSDSIWLPMRQEFDYETKVGRKKTFFGKTVMSYSDYEPNYVFPEKYFNNEISVTTQEAYERDSIYWDSARPEPLTIEQQQLVNHLDSIEAAHNRKEYKDSIQERYNKVTILDVLYEGLGWRNYEKQQRFRVSSILNTFDMQIIGGIRINPYAYYSKRWDNGKSISTHASMSVGTRNRDVQGGGSFYFYFDPLHMGSINVWYGRGFTSVFSSDAYLNQIKRSNYVLNDRSGIMLRREFINGLYAIVRLSLNHYQSVENYEFGEFVDRFIDDNDPLIFENYKKLITEFNIYYTPFQKYVTEPNRKIVLGSVFPTIGIRYKKGWNGLLDSTVDFDYLEFDLKQDIIFGAMGNSKYTVKTGKFLNSKTINLIDLKRFRKSDPYLFSNSLNTFQLLDTTMVTTDAFIELHYMHHFNGALVNFIPFVKKLRIRTVAGAGSLWVKENNYNQFEILAGLERVFKLGKRRRLRIGVYGVAAESNKTSPKASYKVSFDIIDTWNRNWNY